MAMPLSAGSSSHGRADSLRYGDRFTAGSALGLRGGMCPNGVPRVVRGGTAIVSISIADSSPRRPYMGLGLPLL